MGVSRWGGPRRTRRTPRPSSPWQPDQFANRRQPRLTYRVFLGLFFSYLPPRFSSLVCHLFLLHRAPCDRSLCLSTSFPFVSFLLFFLFSQFRLLTRVYTYVMREKRKRGEVAEPFSPRIPLRLLLPSVSLLFSLSLFNCYVFCTRSRRLIQTHREMGVTLILPTTDTTPSARLIRTWRL